MSNVNSNPFLRQKTTDTEQFTKKELQREYADNEANYDISAFDEFSKYNSSYVNKNSLFDDIDCEFEYTNEETDEQEDKNIFE